ncbi:UNVERIFIED_CONTAM: hypothetical protein K2H54_056539 [Gekko kuhli]
MKDNRLTPKSVKSFFTQTASLAAETLPPAETSEMTNSATPIEQEESRDELTISKQELAEIHKDLHRSLREAVEEIVHPLKMQFHDFMQELRDTGKKAEDNAATCAALQTEEKKIIVLLDLSVETLEKRKSLKLFSAKLYAANIRFRWSPTSDIIVFKNGTQHLVYDASSGKDLLKICGIPITPEEESQLQK